MAPLLLETISILIHIRLVPVLLIMMKYPESWTLATSFLSGTRGLLLRHPLEKSFGSLATIRTRDCYCPMVLFFAHWHRP